MTARNRILAIDDNPTNLLVMEEALGEAYDIETAADGLTGLRLAQSNCPEVVLLDVMMPGLDGYEVCRRFKTQNSLRQSRIIMVSARTGLEDRLMGYDAGADDYVTKPFDVDELETKIGFALRAKRMEQLCGATGEVLTLVVGLRDAGMVRNAERTRACCDVLARQLAQSSLASQIDDRFIDDLHQAAVLRDVGLLAIPTSARTTQNLRNSQALEQYKQHTLIGSRLMNRFAGDHPEVSLFRMAAEVARSHHENFDGSGYPDRLRGDAIPLAARMMKVIDSLEAAVDDDAPLAPPMLDHVRDEVAQGSGVHFDPEVAQAFAETFDELADVVDNHLVAQLP
jgi:putative two-component system response regulator